MSTNRLFARGRNWVYALLLAAMLAASALAVTAAAEDVYHASIHNATFACEPGPCIGGGGG